MGQTFRLRVRAGDHAAFAELFDEHAGAIYRHALRLTGHVATAEDVVSQTFLEAWRLRARVRPQGDSLRPWLFGIATNVLRNTRRAARRHRAALARLPIPHDSPDAAAALVSQAAEMEERAAARAALGELRRPEREVVALCVWSGLTYAEAAEALGVPIGTVRSRLSRAKARLQWLAQRELHRLRAAAEPQPVDGQVRGAHTTVGRSLQEGE